MTAGDPRERGPMRRRVYSGAELVANVSASPYRLGVQATRREMLCTRSGDNQTTLVYANAGHPAPFLQRADGTVRRMQRGGPVLGVVAEADYEEGVLALGHGDRLVLVTDGITEAGRDGASELGDERLLAGLRELRPLAAAEAAARVLELARTFGGDRLTDDATVVVADVEAAPRR